MRDAVVVGTVGVVAAAPNAPNLQVEEAPVQATVEEALVVVVVARIRRAVVVAPKEDPLDQLEDLEEEPRKPVP